jgi:peroxin-14
MGYISLSRHACHPSFCWVPKLNFSLKRYIAPLIAPPTPSQLQQDKQTVDEQFSRAFSLIEQLANDTAALKSAEEARSERLDAALREVESVVSELKTAARRKDDETHRIGDEIKSLKESIPRAIEGAKEGNENRLKELGMELRSLKVLMGNRLGGSSGSGGPTTGRMITGATISAASRASDETAVSSSISTAPQSSIPTASATTPAPTGVAQPPLSDSSSNLLPQLGRSASIPAWQMAAVNRSKSASQADSSNSNEEHRSLSTS